MSADTKTTTIIPAHPGWFVLYPSMYENDRAFDKADLHPIIAWRVETTTFQLIGGDRKGQFQSNDDATPVVAGGLSSDWMVVTPTGTVEDPHVATYDTVEKAIEAIHNGSRYA